MISHHRELHDMELKSAFVLLVDLMFTFIQFTWSVGLTSLYPACMGDEVPVMWEKILQKPNMKPKQQALALILACETPSVAQWINGCPISDMYIVNGWKIHPPTSMTILDADWYLYMKYYTLRI
jgi:hypothetical protein